MTNGLEGTANGIAGAGGRGGAKGGEASGASGAEPGLAQGAEPGLEPGAEQDAGPGTATASASASVAPAHLHIPLRSTRRDTLLCVVLALVCLALYLLPTGFEDRLPDNAVRCRATVVSVDNERVHQDRKSVV